jgi:hypothetical protein
MRSLPDPDLSLRDACDFIFESSLARKALELPIPANLGNLLRVLIHGIYRLTQSCHLPEFTDHGLTHLCSLVDRISRWSAIDGSTVETLIVEQEEFSSEDAAVLLLATLVHDLGMLSQRPEDMPDGEDQLSGLIYRDVPTWVRRSHIQRLPKLLQRTLAESPFEGAVTHEVVRRAVTVAQAHGDWPWAWRKFNFARRDEGLAAMLAVADLLDEDTLRCDSATLLKHRFGTALNCAHWLRHELTMCRVLIVRGRVAVSLARPENVDATMVPVFDALRNHYKLILAYNRPLGVVGAGLLGVDFSAPQGIPNEVNSRMRGWSELPEFRTQAALKYHLLDSFMAHALVDERRLSPDDMVHLSALNLTRISLSDYYTIKGTLPPRTDNERAYRALLTS